MYAVIVSGGKQYRVSQGDVIYVEKLDQEGDSTVNLDVRMAGGEEGVEGGTPTLAGAKVEGKVGAQVKGITIAVPAIVRPTPRWKSLRSADDPRRRMPG